MADVEISLSVIPSPLTRAVLDGTVKPEGVALRAQPAQSVDANSRRMLDLEIDVGEMSLATFTKAREQGVPLVGLPLFTGRRFLQGSVTVAPGAGIRDPSELRGKRVGLPQFWMTSSVWHRLVLRQAHGVSQEEVHWVTTASERMEALRMPNGVDVRLDASGRSPRDLLISGEVDAIMSPRGGPPRGEGAAPGDGEPVPAFADPIAAQRDYYQRFGIFPIMHMVVMKEELARRAPWLVESLCDAFDESKERGRSDALDDPRETPISGDPAATRALMGDDPWRYGIAASRHVLETFLRDVFDQGLIQRPLGVDDLFPGDLSNRYR
jgi:4,5-dihydroxyphthalate decarboxylase